MTHALSAAVDQALARARTGVDVAVDYATERVPAGYERGQRVASIAVDLLAEGYACCFTSALVAAEAIERLVERTPTVDAAAPIPFVPALDEIRRADDYPGFGG